MLLCHGMGWQKTFSGHNFLHCKKLLEHFIVSVYNLDIKVKNTKEKVKVYENA